MTALELETIFDRNNVPRHYYSFGRPSAGDCLALEANNGTYLICYYSERGDRDVEGSYPTEDAACREFFRRIARVVQDGKGRSIAFKV